MEENANTAAAISPTKLGWKLACAALLGSVSGAVWFSSAYGGDLASSEQTGLSSHFGDVINGTLQTWQLKVISVSLLMLPAVIALGVTVIEDMRRHQFRSHRRMYLLFALWSVPPPLVMSLIIWLAQGNFYSDGQRFWLGWAMLFFVVYFLLIPTFILPGLVSFCVAGLFGGTDANGALYGATAWLAFVLAYTLTLIHGFAPFDIAPYAVLMVVFMLAELPFAALLGKWGEQMRGEHAPAAHE